MRPDGSPETWYESITVFHSQRAIASYLTATRADLECLLGTTTERRRRAALLLHKTVQQPL